MVSRTVRSWTIGAAAIIVAALAVPAFAAPPAAGPAPPPSASPAASPPANAASSTSAAGTTSAAPATPPALPPTPEKAPPPPPAASPPPAGAAPGPEKADSPAPAPGAEAPLKMLALTVGGGLFHASDDRESSGQRGAAGVELALRLDGSARGLEIAAGYEDQLGPWEYIQKTSALDGSGAQRTPDFEQRHRIWLDVRYDVLRLVRKGLPVHVSPMLGLGLVKVDASVYNSLFFGGGGGGVLAWDLDPRTTADGYFSVTRGFVSDGGLGSMFGSITGLFTWGAGVSLGATDWSRIRLGYVGEALDRQATTRFTHGARLSFTVSFL